MRPLNAGLAALPLQARLGKRFPRPLTLSIRESRFQGTGPTHRCPQPSPALSQSSEECQDVPHRRDTSSDSRLPTTAPSEAAVTGASGNTRKLVVF